LSVQLWLGVHAPPVPLPSQTWFVPQLVPAALLVLASTHLLAPVAHDVVPFLQALGFVVHEVPAVQATQVPLPLQTMLVPQPVPAALLLPSTHVIAPVEHEVVPFLHAAFGLVVHEFPAVQATQMPLPLQTWLVPQLAPADLLPPSTQVMTPLEHDVVPALQTLGLPVQELFCTQGPQMPLLHTMFIPQLVPFALFPVSLHTGTPVTHEVVPVLHTFEGWQVAPVVQALQLPLLQTRFVPHDVPLARFRVVSVQAIGLQLCVPAWHGFAGVQDMPTVHDTQAPLLQTRFVPHDVPLATLAVSVQTGAPVVHTIAAIRQGLPLTVQDMPA